MKKYKAVGNQLLMRPLIQVKLDVDQSSGLGVIGGILIPDGAKVGAAPDANPMVEFRVVSAGPECRVAKDGDIVLVNGHIALKIPLGETNDSAGLVMVAENLIIAVVENLPDEVAKTD
jgi:hypothetical protein